MKKIKRVTAIAIALVVGISMLLVLMSAISADRKSQQELRETDKFIAQFETAKAETESTVWVMEAADEKSVKDNSIVNDRDNNRVRGCGSVGDGDGIQEDPTPALVEDLAAEVINKGINGPEREAYLGERYKEVQAWIDANYVAPQKADTSSGYAEDYSESRYAGSGSGSLSPDGGINYYHGTLETYYNLDMSGVVEWMHSLGYEGDYWVRGDGVKMFGDYVMVAAAYDQYPKGSIVETSLGIGMVCDTGEGGYDWFDIAVEW